MNQEPSFGRFVRERRRALDLTQEELARRVGCAAITIRKILKGRLTNQVSAIAYSPDGTRLATQETDGLVFVYAPRVEDLIDIALSRLTRWFTLEECLQYLHNDTCPPDIRSAQ